MSITCDVEGWKRKKLTELFELDCLIWFSVCLLCFSFSSFPFHEWCCTWAMRNVNISTWWLFKCVANGKIDTQPLASPSVGIVWRSDGSSKSPLQTKFFFFLPKYKQLRRIHWLRRVQKLKLICFHFDLQRFSTKFLFFLNFHFSFIFSSIQTEFHSKNQHFSLKFVFPKIFYFEYNWMKFMIFFSFPMKCCEWGQEKGFFVLPIANPLPPIPKSFRI